MRSALATACVVCGADRRRRVLTIERWEIAACRGCGTHRLFPEPDGVVLEEFNDGSGYDGAFGMREEMLAQHDRSLRALERRVPAGRLLDVGCGPGFLLEAACARGWSTVGVDPSAFAVARARKEGFEAHEGMLEDVDLAPASFDALALLQVVEHMTDPRPLLAACHRLLRPGGALLVATPNPRSLLARAKGERFNYWIPPVHCAWYTPRALARLLDGNGFRTVRRSTWGARTDGLHDGRDIVGETAIGRRLPFRARRALGTVVARAADALRMGAIVEHIALRKEDA